jgi:ferredoxin
MNPPYHYIKPNCTRCGACVPVCPTQCIYFGINQYVIDSDRCVNCGKCHSACQDWAIEVHEEKEPEKEPEKTPDAQAKTGGSKKIR